MKYGKRISGLMDKEFDSDSVYGDNDKYIKSKIKSYENNMQTDFHKKGVPRENVPCNCPFVIMLESVIKIEKKYHPQIFLEKCKYEIKKNKTERFINDDSDPGLSDESDNESDNEESKD